LYLAAAVIVGGFIAPYLGPGPFADRPSDVSLQLGDGLVTVEGGNESCLDLYERRLWAWRAIASSRTFPEFGWVPPIRGDRFCDLSARLGEWTVRLPDLPKGTYRVCGTQLDGCSKPVQIP
jgi:hypothetical protein